MKSRCLRVAAFFFFPQKKKALTGAFQAVEKVSTAFTYFTYL